jgi:hypothetical protein
MLRPHLLQDPRGVAAYLPLPIPSFEHTLCPLPGLTGGALRI